MSRTERSRCVVLFSRSPLHEGTVKGLRDAQALFEMARRRVAEAAGALGLDVVLIGEGPAPPGVPTLPQRGGGFGERLRNAFSDVRALGYQEVVAVPSDVPGLTADSLREAFRALAEVPCVLGPSPDGGVYLIGVAGEAGPLLGPVRWRTSHVASDLALELSRRGERAVWLSPLLDVDRRRDLVALRRASGLDPLLSTVLWELLVPRAAPLVPVPVASPGPVRRPADARGPPPLRAAA